MKINAFFSIVMPAYNCASYLSKTLDSLMNQTFKDYEIIIVNDGSTDKTIDVAKQYSEKYSFIKIVDKKINEGLPKARNSGIDAANGEYVWFMDSDDYVSEELLRNVYNEIRSNGADVVMFGIIEEYYTKDGVIDHTIEISHKNAYYDNKEDIRKEVIEFEKSTLYGYSTNKFYSLEYLRENKLYFTDIKMIEDIDFNIRTFQTLETLSVLDFCAYHYCIRNNSSITQKFIANYFELHNKRIEMLYEQYLSWDMLTDQVKASLAGLYCRYLLSAVQRNCSKSANMTHIERKKWISKQYNDPFFNELVPSLSVNGMLKVLYLPYKKKNSFAALTIGRCVFTVKNLCPMLFSRLKHKK